MADTSYDNVIGNKLRYLRECYFQLTTQQMADLLNIPKSVYQAYESGKRTPETLPPELVRLFFVL
ncbi:MAG: helix-turn-helix domain-containing protein [Proteobacteria bacterium]|nr:helix-turn-helix domain-containing protein [Pseudomonadota bacterium]